MDLNCKDPQLLNYYKQADPQWMPESLYLVSCRIPSTNILQKALELQK